VTSLFLAFSDQYIYVNQEQRTPVAAPDAPTIMSLVEDAFHKYQTKASEYALVPNQGRCSRSFVDLQVPLKYMFIPCQMNENDAASSTFHPSSTWSREFCLFQCRRPLIPIVKRS
jgi:hypothetical protein